jgi:hypothetical protein
MYSDMVNDKILSMLISMQVLISVLFVYKLMLTNYGNLYYTW